MLKYHPPPRYDNMEFPYSAYQHDCKPSIPHPLHYQSIVLTSTVGEKRGEKPKLEDTEPIAPSVITPIATKEELEEILKEQEIQLAPLPVIASSSTPQTSRPVQTPTNAASETLQMETEVHLVAPDLKVEDPDIDISDEQLEGGEDHWPTRLRNRGGSDDMQWSTG